MCRHVEYVSVCGCVGVGVVTKCLQTYTDADCSREENRKGARHGRGHLLQTLLLQHPMVNIHSG